MWFLTIGRKKKHKVTIVTTGTQSVNIKSNAICSSKVHNLDNDRTSLR